MDKKEYERQVADYMRENNATKQEAERSVRATMTNTDLYFLRKRSREKW